MRAKRILLLALGAFILFAQLTPLSMMGLNRQHLSRKGTKVSLMEAAPQLVVPVVIGTSLGLLCIVASLLPTVCLRRKPDEETAPKKDKRP